MPNPGFTHLETHSHYTLLGSTVSVTDLANRAAAEGPYTTEQLLNFFWAEDGRQLSFARRPD